VLDYRIFQIIMGYLYWPKFIQVIFCNCSFSWTIQLLRGVFYLDISFICWFRVIRVFFCVCWSPDSWRSWWSRRQGVRKYHNHWCTDTLGGLFATCPWDLLVSLMEHFFLAKSKTSGLRTTLIKCQDFQVATSQITAIFLWF